MRDELKGTLRRVQIVGLKSRNGGEYPADVLRQACSRYENAKVYGNHSGTPDPYSRDVFDIIGFVRNVRFVETEGLYGDVVLNPEHPQYGQLRWIIENAPDTIGLSHVVEALVDYSDDGLCTVKHIYSVVSVDLVTSPAATNGLITKGETNENVD